MSTVKLFKGDEAQLRWVYNLLLPPDTWPKGHTWWTVDGVRSEDVPAAFCSAVFWPELSAVYLSSAGVTPSLTGHLYLHDDMIETRAQWARKQGVEWLVTYCALDNYASLKNLMTFGFMFTLRRKRYRGRWTQWHVGTYPLSRYPTDSELTRAFHKMMTGT